jgi:chemotaxis signal transduction protein
MPQIDIPENTPVGVIGILNYNDVMIKVVDLCPFLGFETQPFSINNQLIIVCVKGQYFAVQADSIVNRQQAAGIAAKNAEIQKANAEIKALKKALAEANGEITPNNESQNNSSSAEADVPLGFRILYNILHCQQK